MKTIWKLHHRLVRIALREIRAGREKFVAAGGTFRLVDGLLTVDPSHWNPDMALKALKIRA